MGYITKYISKGDMWGGLTEQEAFINRSFLKGRRFVRAKRGSAPAPLTTYEPAWESCCFGDRDSCELDGLWDHF